MSNKKGNIIITSKGLNTRLGFELIKKELQKEESISSKTILLVYEPYFSVESILIRACMEIGFQKNHIFLCNDRTPKDFFYKADYIYVSEGNTFELFDILQQQNHLPNIKEAVLFYGATYIGASAGAIIAGSTIKTASLVLHESNFSGVKDMDGMNLLNDRAVLPHYKEEMVEDVILAEKEIGDIILLKNDDINIWNDAGQKLY